MNRLLTKTFSGSTPHERWTGQKPRIAHVRVFGCYLYAYVPKSLRVKLDPTAKRVRFLGTKGVKGYKTLDEESGKVSYTRTTCLTSCLLRKEIQLGRAIVNRLDK